MWYAIFSEDVENSLQNRLKTRAAHVARLKTLVDEGRLLVAGPHPAIDADDPGEAGFTGSLLIVDFPSLAEAQAWAGEDPYMEADVYHKVTVKPFRKVLP